MTSKFYDFKRIATVVLITTAMLSLLAFADSPASSFKGLKYEMPVISLVVENTTISVGDTIHAKVVPSGDQSPKTVFWRIASEDWEENGLSYQRKAVKPGVIVIEAVAKNENGVFSQLQRATVVINPKNGSISGRSNSSYYECIYITTFGVLHLSSEGDDAMGSYIFANERGTLKGKWQDNLLTGQWTYGHHKGMYQFIFNQDRSEFMGVTGDNPLAPDMPWNGKRVICL